MSAAETILNSLREEIENLTQQRRDILNQLTLINLQIKNYDKVAINIDREALVSIQTINNSIDAVKAAYDALIISGCRNDLAWVEVERWNERIQGGAGDGSQIRNVEYVKYEVQRDPSLRRTIPYHGIKYYRQPSNRDYGTLILGSFNGTIEIGSNSLAIFGEGLPSGIEIGNFITDSVDTPIIFNPNDFPSIIGIGTTSYVGILTSLGGRISSGSTVFLHSGSGSLTGVSTGMVLIRPSILQEDSRIVGFGTSSFLSQYFTQSGVSTVGLVTCNTLILDKPSITNVNESEFKVGIINTLNSVALSTNSVNGTELSNFIIFRKGDLENIDQNFDPTGNPNAPLEIGIIDNSRLGVGHSVFYTTSGEPYQIIGYNQNETYFDPTKNRVVNPEPTVGAGRVEYYEGNQLWPIKTNPELDPLNNNIIGYSTAVYATLGEVVIIQSGSGIGTGTTVGYATTGPSSSVCTTAILNNLLNTINTSNSNKNTNINNLQPIAERLTILNRTLKRNRSSKELYAWSLLQGASYLRGQLDELQEDLRLLTSINLNNFN